MIFHSSRRAFRRGLALGLAVSAAGAAACGGVPTAPAGARGTGARATSSDPGASVSRGGGIKRRGGYNVVAD